MDARELEWHFDAVGLRPVMRWLAAVERLRRLAAEDGADLSPETIFAMGEIAERYRRSARERRDRFPETYKRVTGKTWKAFAKLIEAERPVQPPAAAPAPPPAGSGTT